MKLSNFFVFFRTHRKISSEKLRLLSNKFQSSFPSKISPPFQWKLHFFPSLIFFIFQFQTGEREFDIMRGGKVDGDECLKLSLPWDFPPTPYGPQDKPWVVDYRYSQPDADGNTWPLPDVWKFQHPPVKKREKKIFS